MSNLFFEVEVVELGFNFFFMCFLYWIKWFFKFMLFEDFEVIWYWNVWLIVVIFVNVGGFFERV